MNNRILKSVALALTFMATAVALPATAQYDRDGRYVPSPMGVPTDPHARIIQGYPGTPTPGGAVGAPVVPRDHTPGLAPMKPRVGVEESVLTTRTVPLNKKRCAAGWNKKLGITSAEFEIRCAKINRDDQ